MRSRAVIGAKLLSCVLALLAAIQPAAALDCACACNCGAERLELKSEQAEEEHCPCGGACCSDDRCQSNCDDGMRNSAESIDWITALGLRPCQCPRDCDCHLRHSPPSGLLPVGKLRVAKQHIASTIAIHSNWPRADQSIGAALDRLEYRQHLVVDAPSSCAVLCRFTI